MKREGERTIISAALHPYAMYPTPLCYVPSPPSPRTGNREGKKKAGTKVTQLIMKNVEKHRQTDRDKDRDRERNTVTERPRNGQSEK